MARTSKRIVLATIGSLGDLHPCLAVALGLRERGHQPVIASTDLYRGKVENLGLEFHGMRPRIPARDPVMIRELMDMRRGPEYLLRRLILPALRETYEDLAAISRGADLLIAGEIVFAAPLVAEKLGLPWVSALLSPFSFYSAYDPPVSPLAPELGFLQGAGRPINLAILWAARLGTRHWWKPVRRLRAELGLSVGRNPLFDDKFSRELTLALFSPELARPQADWPSPVVQPGFVYYDAGETKAGLPADLLRFLEAGEAPIIFTLGSTAVNDPRNFFEESAEAARRLDRRAVFLVGDNEAPAGLGDAGFAARYAPFSEIFPRACAVVHQGGVGTTAQALRAGRPALMMPCGFDQPDNAARVERMGAGISLSRNRYNARTASGALQRLLSEAGYAAAAGRIGRRLKAEQGLDGACDAIERLLHSA